MKPVQLVSERVLYYIGTGNTKYKVLNEGRAVNDAYEFQPVNSLSALIKINVNEPGRIRQIVVDGIGAQSQLATIVRKRAEAKLAAARKYADYEVDDELAQFNIRATALPGLCAPWSALAAW